MVNWLFNFNLARIFCDLYNSRDPQFTIVINIYYYIDNRNLLSIILLLIIKYTICKLYYCSIVGIITVIN